MRATITEDAEILIPNQDHQNFTASGQIIKKGVEVEGNEKLVQGLRRGKPFVYRLFLTNDKQLIYLKKIKPMEVTEVTLGADAKQSPTVVSVPEGKKLLTRNVIIGTLVGAGAGFGWSKYKKLDKKKTMIYTAVGAVVGFAVAKYIEKRKAVVVKPSK